MEYDSEGSFFIIEARFKLFLFRGNARAFY